MDVTLAEIQSTPLGKFSEFHIAAICKEVLQGIQYIHDALHIVHGDLDVHNVMVDRAGRIKILNIGHSMLQCTAVSDGRLDLKAMGRLMIRLMEIETSLKSSDASYLDKPGKWGSGIKKFLERTFDSTLKHLLDDPFLESS